MDDTLLTGSTKSDGAFWKAYRQGTELLHQGRASAAVPILEQAHEIKPDDVDAGINLAGAYILSKKFSKAVSVLEPLSEQFPDQAMLWTNLGAAYLGNPVLAEDEAQLKAIAAFERALTINPRAPSVAYNIGLIYRDRKDFKNAVRWFGTAVQNDPQDRDAVSLLSKLTAHEGQD